jgi:hypothetical protein
MIFPQQVYMEIVCNENERRPFGTSKLVAWECWWQLLLLHEGLVSMTDYLLTVSYILKTIHMHPLSLEEEHVFSR